MTTDTHETPQCLIDAVVYYRDPEHCFSEMVAAKWPNGKIACPKCGTEKVGLIKTRRTLQCNEQTTCGKQFSVKVGTIFEDSPLPLWKWLVAVWCIANAKNGISSLELSRAIKVTQKTAWFMLHRIRLAMRTPTARKFSGTVEGDESFFGGKAKNMHRDRRARLIRGRGAVGKAIVQGLLERSAEGTSQFRGFVIPNTEEGTLCPNVFWHVDAGSRVYTDAASSYGALGLRYFHSWIDHVTRYVRGAVHTNGLENFWSLFKRTIGGTYVAVADFHLSRYLDEQAFRFNFRGLDDAGRFQRLLAAVVGKRLTYRELTAQGDAGFMGIR